VATSERDVKVLEAAGFAVRRVERDGEWSKPGPTMIS